MIDEGIASVDRRSFNGGGGGGRWNIIELTGSELLLSRNKESFTIKNVSVDASTLQGIDKLER